MRYITLNPSSWGSVTVAQKSHKLQVGGSIPLPAIEDLFFIQIGKVAEWFKAFVLKTKEMKVSGGSNPLLSVAPYGA